MQVQDEAAFQRHNWEDSFATQQVCSALLHIVSSAMWLWGEPTNPYMHVIALTYATLFYGNFIVLYALRSGTAGMLLQHVGWDVGNERLALPLQAGKVPWFNKHAVNMWILACRHYAGMQH
jgi:hypothetical protein